MSTVSRALRNDPRVKKATREIIQKTAADLGYQPNIMARNLSEGKTRTVWLIAPGLNALEREIAISASRCMNANGFDLAITLFHGDEDIHKRLLERLGQGVADGAIILPTSPDSHIELYENLISRNIPIVFMDRHIEKAKAATFTTDNASASEQLANLCHRAGAREFVVLFNENNLASKARKEGAAKRLQELGCPAIFEDKPIMNFSSKKIAILCNAQQTIQNFISSHSTKSTGKDFVFGVFDEWQGEPHPAKKAFVCMQDFEEMVKRACRKILAMIDKNASSRKQIIKIPPLEFKTIKRSF